MRTRILGLVLLLATVGCCPCLDAPPGQPGRPHPVVGAAVVTQFSETINLGATIRSAAQQVTKYDNIGIAVRSTGTSAGTWTLQYSNDCAPIVDDPTSDAKWDTYTLGTTPPAAAGAPQTFGIVVDNFEFACERVKYTYVSGAGSAFLVTQLKGN
jgi:hypothetical protein